MITIDQTERIDDATGRRIIRFTPLFRGADCCSTGELRFAYFEEWSDASLQAITAAAKSAQDNAREVFKKYAEDLY